MITIVSPHLDDAVLSLAEHILTFTDPVTVLTVFSEGAPHRNDENARALRLLGAHGVDLGLTDDPHRDGTPPDLQRELIRATRDSTKMLLPLGIRHQDHLLVSDVAIDSLDRDQIVGFYEELPYRVMWPDDRAARVADLARSFPSMRVDACGGHLEAKRAAVHAYTSQVGEDIERCAFAPERIWWIG